MPGETTLRSAEPVKQFSVFALNRVGSLSELAQLLKQGNVHVMAVTVLDTTDSAIVRLIVDDPEKAKELMAKNGFSYAESEIVAVEIRDESALTGVLATLLEAEVNVDYVYSFLKRPQGRAALAIKVDYAEVAGQALGRRGYKVLSHADIAR